MAVIELWPSLEHLVGDHVYSPGAKLRWQRLFQRLLLRAQWHWQGLLLWLLQRPQLRGWVMPWPGTETVSEYMAQPGARRAVRKLSAEHLLELVDLRNRMGMVFSFMENDSVLQAIRIARQRSGVMSRMRRAVVTEATTRRPPGSSGASSGPVASSLIGPRGGLPRTKAELQELAASMRLDTSGTVAQLQARIRGSIAGVPKTPAAAQRAREAYAGSAGCKPSPASVRSAAEAQAPVRPSSGPPLPAGISAEGRALISYLEDRLRQAIPTAAGQQVTTSGSNAQVEVNLHVEDMYLLSADDLMGIP